MTTRIVVKFAAFYDELPLRFLQMFNPFQSFKQEIVFQTLPIIQQDYRIEISLYQKETLLI